MLEWISCGAIRGNCLENWNYLFRSSPQFVVFEVIHSNCGYLLSEGKIKKCTWGNGGVGDVFEIIAISEIHKVQTVLCCI
jgi:hypothetical protein